MRDMMPNLLFSESSFDDDKAAAGWLAALKCHFFSSSQISSLHQLSDYVSAKLARIVQVKWRLPRLPEGNVFPLHRITHLTE